MNDTIHYDVQPEVKDDDTVEITVKSNGAFLYAYRVAVPDEVEDEQDFAFQLAAAEIAAISLAVLRAKRALTESCDEIGELFAEAREAGRQEQRVKSLGETLKEWSKGDSFTRYGNDAARWNFGFGGSLNPSGFGG